MACRQFSAISLAFLYLTIQHHVLRTSGASVTEYSVDRANQFVAEHKGSVNQTYREKYHLMAPYGWINDPNGFIYFRGEYHLFYQYNPYDTQPGSIHWGHSKSKDLLHWEDLPVALAPDQEYDKAGVFSGSAIEKDGKMYLMYTGNDGNSQVQCIAVSEDGIHFEKLEQNPVLKSSDLPENAKPKDFRDPKVFKRGDTYYAVTVSNTKADTGQVLMYESPDLISWKFKSIVLEGNKRQGRMWECPDLYELDGKDVLTLSPEVMPTSGDDYQNFDSVVEFIGKFDWDSGTFKVETTKEIDHGLDFYATQSLIDDKNRRIVVAWMNMWKRDYPTSTLDQGWTGAMTLPRELHVQNGQLIQRPISEITNLYKNPVFYRMVPVFNEVKELSGVSGDVGVLELNVNLLGAKTFKIELRANEDEKTVLSYNTYDRKLTLDRGDSGHSIKGAETPGLLQRKVEVPLMFLTLKLQVFLDKSSVEVFVNDGVETMTTTVYPTKLPADKIRFGAEGRALITNLRFSTIEP